ncbi:MAG: radical SAM protein [Lentisphaeria bacterium]|nr:radical SAM protein [Lentisphaeria bacterium]
MGSPEISKTTLTDYMLERKIGAGRVPLSFDFELTARCNNDCGHCYINVPAEDARYQEEELSLQEIERIADEAVAMGTLWCLLSGGEPLLREDFDDVYLSLKRKGLLVSVYTNASLITERHVELFKKYPPRDLEVTVYGVTPETFARVTNRPSGFSQFQRGLNRLLDNKIPVRLKAMALRSNVHELPEIAAFCREHTKDYFRFDPLLNLRHDRDPARNQRILAERLTPEEIARIDHADLERSEALRKDCGIYIHDAVEQEDCAHLFHCGAGLNSFHLSHNGQFRLCGSLCAPDCVYDLRNGSLREAWTQFAPRVLAMETTDSEVRRKCIHCPIFNLCLWCPAHAYLECGHLDRWSEYFCKVAHAREAALKDRLG